MGQSVALKYDPEWRALEWAKENCPSYITNSVNEDSIGMDYATGAVNYTIDYWFGEDGDATLFRLRWC